jgi:phosphohistidine swiveling domain-containing protein
MPFTPIEWWQREFESILRRKIEENNLKEKEALIWSSASRPWKKTSILELEAKLKKGVSVERIIKEYQFLRSMAFVWYRPIDKEWVDSIKKSLKTKKRQKLLSISELERILKLNNSERRLFEVAPYLIFIKDWRDDIRRMHAYHWLFLFDIIAEKYKINRKDLGYFSLDEMEESLIKRYFDRAVARRRKQGSIVITKDFKRNKIKIIEGKEIGGYKKIVEKLEKVGEGKVVRGIIAQAGFARGAVKILKTYHDIKRVKEGDIIVAVTTHPNYLPAMKKAAAFVTDEGGIASHAAIVAREFKKPCLVGTKIATRVLRDGDLVEVDANKGVVKILKKLKRSFI